MILHALVNLGRQDIDPEGTTPLDSRIRVLGASSDYLALDVSAIAGQIRVGDELGFTPNYSALLRCMTSAYMHKQLAAGHR